MADAYIRECCSGQTDIDVIERNAIYGEFRSRNVPALAAFIFAGDVVAMGLETLADPEWLNQRAKELQFIPLSWMRESLPDASAWN